jgi:hypothetical protein
VPESPIVLASTIAVLAPSAFAIATVDRFGAVGEALPDRLVDQRAEGGLDEAGDHRRGGIGARGDHTRSSTSAVLAPPKAALTHSARLILERRGRLGT